MMIVVTYIVQMVQENMELYISYMILKSEKESNLPIEIQK